MANTVECSRCIIRTSAHHAYQMLRGWGMYDLSSERNPIAAFGCIGSITLEWRPNMKGLCACLLWQHHVALEVIVRGCLTVVAKDACGMASNSSLSCRLRRLCDLRGLRSLLGLELGKLRLQCCNLVINWLARRQAPIGRIGGGSRRIRFSVLQSLFGSLDVSLAPCSGIGRRTDVAILTVLGCSAFVSPPIAAWCALPPM